MSPTPSLESGRNEPIHTVSEINQAVKQTLTDRFPVVWVEGEISEINRHRNGAWYFTIKDDKASLSCVMWANNNRRVRQQIDSGNLVQIRASLTLWEGRGQFQANVYSIQLAGQGALLEAFERLKEKLREEGLFDDRLKRPLPRFPDHIAVITSSEGDARRDVFSNIRRRYPMANLYLVPCSVQGSRAEREVVSSLQHVGEMDPRPDLAILTRGGGSIEDLWTFNLESVARAIRNCEVPVVSAIGHEPDRTIADFVADVRAATPSTAAEIVTPHQDDLYRQFQTFKAQVEQFAESKLNTLNTELLSQSQRVVDPRRLVDSHRRRISEIRNRARNSIQVTQSRLNERFNNQRERLQQTNPNVRIANNAERVRAHRANLTRIMNTQLVATQERIAKSQNSARGLIHKSVQDRNNRFELAKVQLKNPRDVVRDHLAKTHNLRGRLERGISSLLNQKSQRSNLMKTRLAPLNPLPSIQVNLEKIDRFESSITRHVRNRYASLHERTRNLKIRLDAVHPIRTLERGYAVVAIPDSTEYGRPISAVGDVRKGDTIQINLASGRILADVTETQTNTDS